MTTPNRRIPPAPEDDPRFSWLPGDDGTARDTTRITVRGEPRHGRALPADEPERLPTPPPAYTRTAPSTPAAAQHHRDSSLDIARDELHDRYTPNRRIPRWPGPELPLLPTETRVEETPRASPGFLPQTPEMAGLQRRLGERVEAFAIASGSRVVAVGEDTREERMGRVEAGAAGRRGGQGHEEAERYGTTRKHAHSERKCRKMDPEDLDGGDEMDRVHALQTRLQKRYGVEHHPRAVSGGTVQAGTAEVMTAAGGAFKAPDIPPRHPHRTSQNTRELTIVNGTDTLPRTDASTETMAGTPNKNATPTKGASKVQDTAPRRTRTTVPHPRDKILNGTNPVPRRDASTDAMSATAQKITTTHAAGASMAADTTPRRTPTTIQQPRHMIRTGTDPVPRTYAPTETMSGRSPKLTTPAAAASKSPDTTPRRIRTTAEHPRDVTSTTQKLHGPDHIPRAHATTAPTPQLPASTPDMNNPNWPLTPAVEAHLSTLALSNPTSAGSTPAPRRPRVPPNYPGAWHNPAANVPNFSRPLTGADAAPVEKKLPATPVTACDTGTVGVRKSSLPVLLVAEKNRAAKVGGGEGEGTGDKEAKEKAGLAGRMRKAFGGK